MKVLIVASYNKNRFAPFVREQAQALQQAGCEIAWFGIRGKGALGYLRELPRLRKHIRDIQPNVIHAHYGLSGLLANIATRRVPVVTTYHGSDINQPRVRLFSRLAMWLSVWNIFVNKARAKGRKASVIPCGVTLSTEQWQGGDKRVLFAGAFDNEVKDAALAFEAMKEVDAQLVELKGYTREQVNQLLCSVRCLLMTSKSEGSPQIIKEALACGCPIVSVDVGDVRERLDGVRGCYVVPTRKPEDIAAAIRKVKAERTNGREKIIADGLTNEQVAKRVKEIYERVVQ